MTTIIKNTRRIALFAMIGLVSILVAACAPQHSNDFLSNIHPDEISQTSSSAD